MRWKLAGAALFICSYGVAATPGDQAKIENGVIRGVISGRVVSYKGIPFAEPPTRDNRWRPPQPVKNWSGVRAAAEYGPDCMQLPFPSDAAPLGTRPSEDCLYVNVWAPVEKAGPVPVMVWIYGGGFVNGGSSPAVYDGSHFAERGVVMVSFNYRVGRFGFFAHPALTKENPAGPLGNYTFMDQIAALKWVRRNVAAFGGDPKNVTVFGESAGGDSVLTLLTSPMSKGLFEKAIIESGGGRANLIPTRHLHESLPNSPSGEEVGLAFAKEAGIAGEDKAALEALRKLPAETLVSGLNMATMGSKTYAGPMLDGKLLVEEPEQALRAGREMKVPIMDGANSMDIGFSFAKTMDEVFAPFKSDKAEAQAVYNSDHSEDVKAIGYMVAADRMMIEPARFVVQTVAQRGRPTYEYRFSYVATSMRSQWQGAPHATEIPFVFDTVAARYGKDLTSEDEAVAKATNSYWVNFAKSGNPNGSGLARWPAYKRESDELLNFKKNGSIAEPDPWKTRLDLTQRVAEAK